MENNKNEFPNSNIQRLEEISELLDYNPQKDCEILVEINDELKTIKGYLENGETNEDKVKICRDKIDNLIKSLRNKVKKDGIQGKQ